MGIAGLLPLLKSITERIHISAFANETVAVDAYSWMHRALYSAGADLFAPLLVSLSESPLSIHSPSSHARTVASAKYAKGLKQMVEYCMLWVRALQAHSVQPLLVFDGARLPAKSWQEESREKSRSEARRQILQIFASNASAKVPINLYSRALDVTPEMAHALILVLCYL